MRLPFVKMHGIGNDYVYLDAVRNPSVERLADRADWSDLVRRISDRHTGIGSDGVIMVCPPHRPEHHCRMRMFNADASEAQMCGNGVRCVAKFAHDRLGIRPSPMLIETGRGVLAIDYQTHAGSLSHASVEMGAAEFDPARIPFDMRQAEPTPQPHSYIIRIHDHPHTIIPVSMGNPHAIEFVADAALVDLARIGPLVEHHPAFPERVNYHIVESVPGPALELRMRTWERGSGITMACGTGACAVAAAAYSIGRSAADVSVYLPGGRLEVAVHQGANGQLRIRMTGPAADVFEGFWPLENS